MRTMFIFLFTGTLILTLNSCNTEEVQHSMVEFDQAFIPVYYYTYSDDMEHAEHAMLILNSKWKELNADFEKKATDAHNWRSSFEMVDAWLKDVDFAIADKNAQLALLHLDHARYELMDLRWREGIDYYLDKVWDLEFAIDIAVQTSEDMKLDLLEWQEFIPMVYKVENTWNDVLNSPLDFKLFELNTEKKVIHQSRKIALQKSIENFVKIAEIADRTEVAKAAKIMQTAYFNYIHIFGDFEATKTYIAIAY